MQINWIQKQGTGRGAGLTNFGVRVKESPSQATKTKRAFSLRLHQTVVAKAKLVTGDTLVAGVGMDGDRQFIAMKRVLNGGYTLNAGGNRPKGEVCNASITVSSDDLPCGIWEFDDVQFTDDGLIVLYLDKAQPEGGAS